MPGRLGRDVVVRHLSIGAGAVSFRADLPDPDVLAELVARYDVGVGDGGGNFAFARRRGAT
jgi:hypothetical protein